uniref:DUF3456 domain-containing protein n=1 Tax=Neogobius melanostomus TaxID=47308 RepID=A0A8C6SCL4_9GOBI
MTAHHSVPQTPHFIGPFQRRRRFNFPLLCLISETQDGVVGRSSLCFAPDCRHQLLQSQKRRRALLLCVQRDRGGDELLHQPGRPKKTINVGSFRLSPDGSMQDKKVPLARSEMHLSDLLDGLCDRMNDYALHNDPDSGEKRYRRFAPREGQGMTDLPDFKHFKFEGPEANALKFACETVREELEDDIISLFQKDSQDVQQQLCRNISGYCRDGGSVKEEL